MSRLPLAKLRTRLALDYRSMRSLRGAALGRVEAFVSALDLRRGREASESDGAAGLATVYRVEFRFRMLRAPGLELPRARAVFEVSAQGHPFEAPRVLFEPGAVPFAPHVHEHSGAVCLGPAWNDAAGNWLLPNLVVHVMKLANYDEPCTRDGFSLAAIAYARSTLRGRPLDPGLDYPVVDERVTHSGSGPLRELTLFRPSSGFAPRAPPAEPTWAAGIAPGRRRL